MEKRFPFSWFLIVILLNSCSTSYNRTYPVTKPYRTTSVTQHNSAEQVESDEYSSLIKTYKPETAEVLTDLLNDSSDNPKASITVKNTSGCNMVLTISGNNYMKKIPIGINKIGSAMVPKNQNYNLSGMVCNSVYQKTKFITTSYHITLSN